MKENLHTEFKSSFNDAVIETLVAFANTKGGKAVLGLDDNGKPLKNFKVGAESVHRWINEIKNKTQPAVIPDTELVIVGGKEIVELSIKEFPVKPVSFKGRYYKKVKNSNHQLSLNEISNLHLKTFNSSWDYNLDTNHNLTAIDEEKVSLFIALWNKYHLVKIEETPFSFLQKLELLRESKITNACFLLFTKNDTVISTIEMGRFQDEITIKDAISVRTDLIAEVDVVLDFIMKHIRKEYIIIGKKQRDEVWEYPLNAIREIVINMIVHRDYMHHGDSGIKIFDDRIEFFNPGELPESISIKNLLNGSYVSDCRNKLIAYAFKEVGWIEKYGSGIKRIKNAFKLHGCMAPVFENFQHGFRVTVFSKQKSIAKVDTEKNIEGINEGINKLLKLIRNKPGQRVPYFVKSLNTSSKNIENNVSSSRPFSGRIENTNYNLLNITSKFTQSIE